MELKRNGIYTYKGNVMNENCKSIIISEEAHKKIVAETFSYGDDETGGVLIGYIYQGQWYVTDVIDAGIKANHTKTFFTYDENYVNHQLKKKSEIYRYPQATLGFYHRHPSCLDTFSLMDEKNDENPLRHGCPWPHLHACKYGPGFQNDILLCGKR